MPPEYLDVAPALLGGWRVIWVRAGARLQSQAILSTPGDVLAVATLLGVSICTADATLRDAARAAGVPLTLDNPERNRMVARLARLHIGDAS